jgi:hypothetical protein
MLPMDVCLYFVDHLDRGGFKPLPNDMDFPGVSGGYNGDVLVESALGRAGLPVHRLGSGHFAYVCEDPFNYERVIKIAMRGHDASLDFYKFVLENPHTIFPVIHALVITKRYYVVCLERLKPVDGKFYISSRDAAMLNHIRRIIGGDGCIAYSPHTKHSDMNGLDMLQKFRHEVMFNRNDMADLEGTRNCMMRGDQIVVTDPIYISPSRLKAVQGLRSIGHPSVRYTYEELDGIRHANDPRQIDASTMLPPIEPHGEAIQGRAMRAVEVLAMREEGIRGHRIVIDGGRKPNPLFAGAIFKGFRVSTATRRMLEHGMLNPGAWMAGPIRTGIGDAGRARNTLVRELKARNPNGVEIGMHGGMARPRCAPVAKAEVPERVRRCKHCDMVLGGVAHRNAIRQLKLASLRGDRGHRKRVVRGQGCQFCCSTRDRDDRWQGAGNHPVRKRSHDSHLDRQRPCRPEWLEEAAPQVADAWPSTPFLANRAGPEMLRFEALQRFDFADAERRIMHHMIQGA